MADGRRRAEESLGIGIGIDVRDDARRPGAARPRAAAWSAHAAGVSGVQPRAAESAHATEASGAPPGARGQGWRRGGLPWG